MKNTYKLLAIVAVLAVVVSFSSCKAGCGCPKFQLEQAPLQ
ncbi:MAG: hypothetical protein ACI94Y_000858 [Maribacter sp.]|jgi:hypothetical protein